MEIKKKVLISVTAADLESGVFYNDKVTEVADGCFYDMPELIKVILPKVKKIGSYCFSSNQALTAVDLPALTTCGNDCFRSNQALTAVDLPALTTCGSYCFSYNQALTAVKLKGFALATKDVDGSCFVVQKEKTSKGIKIYTGYNFLSMTDSKHKIEECFVAEKDGFYAHGETVKKAIGDVQFKIVAEKLKSEPINEDTKITVNHYRLITGACEMGCNSWMAQHPEAKEGILAKDLLPILRKTNAYGLERFEQLVTF